MKATYENAILRAALEAVIPAASTDPERPFLNAICIGADEKQTKFVATDGHWLAEYTANAKEVETAGRAVIDLSRAKKLVQMLAGEDGSVLIVSDDSLVRFEIEGVGRVDCNALSSFPPTDDVWPKGDGKSVSRVGMSPKLLAKIGKAFGARDKGLNFLFFGVNQPILINSDAAEEMRAILMPLRQLELGLP